MSEKGPRFEMYEVYHSPERGDFNGTPEILPDEKCEAELTLYDGGTGEHLTGATYIDTSCDGCSYSDQIDSRSVDDPKIFIRDSFGGIVISGDVLIDAAANRLKDGCEKWKTYKLQAGINPDTQMPDYFLPDGLKEVKVITK